MLRSLSFDRLTVSLHWELYVQHKAHTQRRCREGSRVCCRCRRLGWSCDARRKEVTPGSEWNPRKEGKTLEDGRETNGKTLNEYPHGHTDRRELPNSFGHRGAIRSAGKLLDRHRHHWCWLQRQQSLGCCFLKMKFHRSATLLVLCEVEVACVWHRRFCCGDCVCLRVC